MMVTIVALFVGGLLLGTTAFAGQWLGLAMLAAVGVLAVWLTGAAVRVGASGELFTLVPVRGASQPQRAADRRRIDADGLAIIALLGGVTGLFILNVVLGPLAVALGVSALRRGARLRPTALLATAVGVVDVLLFAAMVGQALFHGGFVWQFGS